MKETTAVSGMVIMGIIARNLSFEGGLVEGKRLLSFMTLNAELDEEELMAVLPTCEQELYEQCQIPSNCCFNPRCLDCVKFVNEFAQKEYRVVPISELTPQNKDVWLATQVEAYQQYQNTAEPSPPPQPSSTVRTLFNMLAPGISIRLVAIDRFQPSTEPEPEEDQQNRKDD